MRTSEYQKAMDAAVNRAGNLKQFAPGKKFER